MRQTASSSRYRLTPSVTNIQR